ncbi:major facilitator superfamily-domain-containing protein [Podospora australis]|uniref:Major facilitator superfamily-domain-containing protein n=1 Tax=Podospora australis TaxID=1536484 RepID=A0AAN6WUN2_9PEZI|nr:major facilitator superfamily-domain-containing protein [Podospora australis]
MSKHKRNQTKSSADEPPLPDVPPELPMPTWQHSGGQSDSSSAVGLVSVRDTRKIGLQDSDETPQPSLPSPISPALPRSPLPQRPTRQPPPIWTTTDMATTSRRTLMEDVVYGSLRNLATSPTPRTPFPFRSPQSVPLSEQRHPGKEGAYIHRSTKPVEFPTDTGPDSEVVQGIFTASHTPDIQDRIVEVEESSWVTGIPLVCLMAGLMLAVFLVSIDRTIISTAVPYITSEFKSTPDIGWYGSAYLLTACAFQPLFGRIYTLFSVKNAYLVGMFLFELGSLLCGVAPNSMCLIVGRAIAGVGCAGILTGSFVVVSVAIPMHLRPIFMAVVGLMFGIGASVGPLLGGVFTDLVTWRWCFYVNLPVGAATVVALIFFFHPKKHTHAHRGLVDRLLNLDILGNILLLGASIMLFLALEYTTIGIPWGSAWIIGLLVGFGLVSFLFAAWQWWKGEEALMPPRIINQRTVAASCGMAFMTFGALINLTYFLPIWFQAVKGDSAIQSGVNMIPYFVVNAFVSLIAGVLVSLVGYVTPPAIIGSAIGTVALGLLTLLNPDTTRAQWIGFEILASAGFGLSIQQGFVAVQTVLGEEDMAIGTAAVVASQSLGGAIFLSVGNSVFQSQLLKASGAAILPGIDIKEAIDAGAASFRQFIPADELPLMLEVYSGAITKVFTVGIPLGVLAAIFACFIEWKSVKPETPASASSTTVSHIAQRPRSRRF